MIEEIKVQYGLEKIPVTRWLDIMLANRLEVLEIRLRWYVLNKKPVGVPYGRETKCTDCGATIRAT